MERLQLVRRHRGLVVVQMRERVLGAVVVGIIVRIDGLGLQARDGIELLDGRGTEARQRTEDRALDLSNLSVLDSVNERVLRRGGVGLQQGRRQHRSIRDWTYLADLQVFGL